MRLIDVDLLKENWKYNFDHKRRLVELFDEQPTVEAVPAVRGKWHRYPDCGVTKCDLCEWSIEECFDGNYCPNCGARMDGE